MLRVCIIFFIMVSLLSLAFSIKWLTTTCPSHWIRGRLLCLGEQPDTASSPGLAQHKHSVPLNEAKSAEQRMGRADKTSFTSECGPQPALLRSF